MAGDAVLIDYYARRASEYERIYRKPERQTDSVRLKDYLRDTLRGRRILELACGTAYWTAALADISEAIYATDANEEVLAIARAKSLDPNKVVFARGDAYSPAPGARDFTAGFAGFWWSHVPLARLHSFLESFHAALLPGARVVFTDNRYVPGSSTPIHRTDADGNTYQLRPLDDGSSHEILKNFPSAEQLAQTLRPFSENIQVTQFEYFWSVSYDLPES